MLGRVRQAKNMSLCRPVEFPLTLGRDFSGEVVATGIDVPAVDFTVGDAVMGVVAPYQQGCHAELVVAPAAQVCAKIPRFPSTYKLPEGVVIFMRFFR